MKKNIRITNKKKYSNFFANLVGEMGITRAEFRKNLQELTGKKWGENLLHYYEYGKYKVKAEDAKDFQVASKLPKARFTRLFTEWYL